jgi:hypothetical protein
MGVSLLEVSKALKIGGLLCIPLKNYFQPYKVKALTPDVRQYFAVLLAAIYGVVEKRIAQLLYANFAIQILLVATVSVAESLRLLKT